MKVGNRFSSASGFESRVARVTWPDQVDPRWSNIRPQHPADLAAWVWSENWHPEQPGCLRFNRQITCSDTQTIIVHLTADQRYQFFLDGELVGQGPDASDLAHWTVTSYQLELAPGPHELSALVWWIPEGDGDYFSSIASAPYAQITRRGGFLFAADGIWAGQLNTGVADWRVFDLGDAVEMHAPVGLGYHVIGPSYRFEMSRWNKSKATKPSIIRGPILDDTGLGVRAPGWQLYPAQLPEQSARRWHGGRLRGIRNGWGKEAWKDDGAHPMTGPFNAAVGQGIPLVVEPEQYFECLWDLETYLCGYPDLEVAGGEGSEIQFEWAEALFVSPDPVLTADLTSTVMRKDHRSRVAGLFWKGFGDSWILDGSTAELPALWWRSGRYVLLRIRTGGARLVLRRIGVRETHYPFKLTGRFSCDDEALLATLPLMERTLCMNAHEVWSDGPHYEQISYVGDNVNSVASLVVAADARLHRRSIELFDWSRNDQNQIAERYPCRFRQESGTYMLLYPLLLDNYLRWRPDPNFARARLPGLRALIEQALTWLKSDGNVGIVPGWPFIDWPILWDRGCGPGVREGDAALLNLHMLLALQSAAAIENAFGERIFAQRQLEVAAQIRRATRHRFWDAERSLLADDAEHKHYSEHAQAFALMTDLLEPGEASACLDGWAAGRDELVPASIYFTHHLLEVFYRYGRDAAFFERLGFWKSLPAKGFVSLPESPEPARSDCHGWGAHPLFHCYASIGGIRPAEYGFTSVRIAPMPGALQWMAMQMPHPEGTLEMELDRASGLCRVILPGKLTGNFIWEGISHALAPGSNSITLSKTSSGRSSGHAGNLNNEQMQDH